jgi:hypothetical protein
MVKYMVSMKRAQAAMEYLMTYGWALLVIVLVLGALIYLGVLNPQGRMQDMCNLPIGFGCEVAGLDGEGNLFLRITNQQATQLTGLAFECDGNTGSVDKSTLNPGDSAIFECEVFSEDSPRNIGDFVNGDFEITYDSGIIVDGEPVDKKITGTYSAKVSIQ